jgi:hypothetical protein
MWRSVISCLMMFWMGGEVRGRVGLNLFLFGMAVISGFTWRSEGKLVE